MRLALVNAKRTLPAYLYSVDWHRRSHLESRHVSNAAGTVWRVRGEEGGALGRMFTDNPDLVECEW